MSEPRISDELLDRVLEAPHEVTTITVKNLAEDLRDCRDENKILKAADYEAFLKSMEGE